MCPDKEILSAHLDGEVPYPWNEQLDRHLAECPGCAALFASLRGLSLRMKNGSPAPAALCARQDQIYQVLMNRRSDREYYRSKHIWSRRVSVSFPILAAAAVVFLFLGAGFFSIVSGFSPAAGARTPMTAAEAPPSAGENSIRVVGDSLENLANLADLLRQREENVQVFIELPAAPIFSSGGEPQFIRAADYNGARPQTGR